MEKEKQKEQERILREHSELESNELVPLAEVLNELEAEADEEE